MSLARFVIRRLAVACADIWAKLFKNMLMSVVFVKVRSLAVFVISVLTPLPNRWMIVVAKSALVILIPEPSLSGETLQLMSFAELADCTSSLAPPPCVPVLVLVTSAATVDGKGVVVPWKSAVAPPVSTVVGRVVVPAFPVGAPTFGV